MNNIAKKIIPSYPFVEFNDDENVVAFFNAYNSIAQQYLDALNELQLPCWTSDIITGPLLDWVALGIYGQKRPSLTVEQSTTSNGEYDSSEYNVTPYAKISTISTSSYNQLSDDIFKRILTWNFYKGDGFQFTIPWLKRRVARFIHGANGVDPILDNTFDVSVTSSSGVFTVNIPDYGDGVAQILQLVISQNLVKLPFIYTFSTTTTVL